MAGGLLNALGVALLVCSVVLVPQGQVLADDGGGSTPLIASCDQSRCPTLPGCRTQGTICATYLPECTTTPDGVCDGCGCVYDAQQGKCLCKLVL
jgi:hypothetical protein